MSDEEVQPQSEPAQSEVQQGEAPQPQGEVVQQQDQPTQSEPDERKPHPLEPDGERFKQIWARSKEAERKAEALAIKLQEEREARIRLEEREKAKAEATQVQEKEYTWAELRGFINEGKLTLDQAIEYRETVNEKKLERKQQALLDSHLKLNTREATIEDTLTRYRKANPALVQDGTPERDKLVKEYQYHVNVLGFPATKATELAAARAAFGDVETLESQARLKSKPVEREGHMETSSAKPNIPKQKDPWDSLDARTKAHYERMIKNGRYGSFKPSIGITEAHKKAVREELAYERPA